MVLSNKKLKLKLRAELPQNQDNVDDNSLKNLLDSAANKPRLSKREKRRKIRSLKPPEEKAESGGGEHEGSKKENESEDLGIKKNKKRKRKVVENHDDDDVANGVLNDANKSKNKKKKKKKKKKAKNHGGEVAEATVLTTATTSSSQDNGDVPTKVYVGGIPYYSTEDDIRSYFESCGTITELDCMSFPESGKFRGIAIISFKTEAAAKRALALDGADMGGLFLKIQPYKATRANKAKTSDFAPEILEGYNRIYVGNLSWDITDEELRKFFSNCNITSIRFGMDKETEEFRGYAHVDFSDSQSLKTALTLDQKVLSGRPVRISCAVPLKKKSVTHTSSVATSNGLDAEKTSNGLDGEKSTTGSGKMKRRTCYECGEKGHYLSACPKKQTVASTTT